MQNKNNIMAFVMLFAAAIASIFCIIKKVPLTQTLQTVLITLVIFMVLGYVAQRIIFKLNDDVREAEEQRKFLEEQEKLRAAEAERMAEEAAEKASGEDAVEEAESTE